ncbi:helix-turn-helix domain-containing protein [Salinilacihabitans rarus]|uniref:helix-turn-helix domain-containing protein n=1 Tax=Salinilacihabitans rarus TaxID=2961596 RepID=UPI0020C87928|nr:helix-turn-helix domain-containing protein [Salinilacihabitans rarus]
MRLERSGAEVGSDDHPMEERPLRVVLEVDRGGPCFMDDLDGHVIDVDVRFDDDRCNCDVTIRERGADGERVCTRFSSSDICDHCPGVVFSEYGCIPRYLKVDAGSFVMETYVEDTETVASLVADIRAVCRRATVRSIVSTADVEFDEISYVDVSKLTAKQREAVHWAKRAGYYDPDSDVSLRELAGKVGVSPSALSQRLQRAEANAMRQLSCECRCWRDGD